MDGAGLCQCGGWSQSFEPSWLVVTGTEERAETRTQRHVPEHSQITDTMHQSNTVICFLPVTIKAHVSVRRSAGRQVFRRTGLPLHFADRRSMKHHCKTHTHK